LQVIAWDRVEVADVGGIQTLVLSSESDDISKAVEVVVDGVASPSLVSATPYQLLAQVPDLIQGKLIHNIEVRTKRRTLTRVSRLTFEADYLNEAKGLARLVQAFAVNLLRRRERGKLGSDQIPAGGLSSLIGTNLESQDQASRAVAEAVSNVTDQMKQRQNPLASPSETIQDANLISVSMTQIGDISAEIRLVTRSNKPAQFAMEF